MARKKMSLYDRLDAFTRQYMETALWSSVDDKGVSLDRDYDITDLAPVTVREMVRDCAAFQRTNWRDIQVDLERAGHDFWLTRNRHGAGFWDGDWGKAGKRLTKAAHAFREVYLYVGYRGRIYQEG